MKNWLSEQWEWFKGFWCEMTPQGMKASSKRLISLIMTWCFVVTYMRVSWDQKTITDIPATWALLIAGLLGLGIYANRVQKENGTGDEGRRTGDGGREVGSKE